jgi:diaminopimelate epimerase
MSGAGNDFMVIDARGMELDFENMALSLCAKTHADGFMAVGLSDKADFRLHFYNSDGTRGEMCGNGARCICKFAFDHGIAGSAMVVETDAGLVYGWRIGENLYRIHLNNPHILDFYRREDAVYVELGNPGIPHSVTELPHLYWEMAEMLRRKATELRFAPEYPKGANVNFYSWTSDTSVRILTYERGVEDYTLACGTGCGSTAAVLWSEGKLPGGKLTLENKGGTLYVTVVGAKGRISQLILEGPAEVIAEYEI